jgi:rubrerythrin
LDTIHADKYGNEDFEMSKERQMKSATQDSLDALSKGINAELAAYVFYKRAADKVTKKEHIDTFLRLAAEEKDHFRILEAEYDSLNRSEKWVTYSDIMRRGQLPDIPAEMAETHRKRFEALPEFGDLEKVLKMAIRLEEDARDLYNAQVAKATDPQAKEMYAFLSKFEQAHVTLINGWLRNLAKSST